MHLNQHSCSAGERVGTQSRTGTITLHQYQSKPHQTQTVPAANGGHGYTGRGYRGTSQHQSQSPPLVMTVQRQTQGHPHPVAPSCLFGVGLCSLQRLRLVVRKDL
jgi:hypothetical protein